MKRTLLIVGGLVLLLTVMAGLYAFSVQGAAASIAAVVAEG